MADFGGLVRQVDDWRSASMIYNTSMAKVQTVLSKGFRKSFMVNKRWWLKVIFFSFFYS